MNKNTLLRLLKKPIVGLIGILIFLMIVGEILIPGFITARSSVFMLLSSASLLGFIALGQTFVILVRGIDLSVGIVYSYSIAMGALLMGGQSFWLPFFAVLGLGAVIGLVNGVGVSWFKIPSIVMTLSMMLAMTGVLIIQFAGCQTGKAAPLLETLGKDGIYNIPYSAMLWIFFTIVAYLLTKQTTFGRKFYFTGSNPRAAHFLGVRVKYMKLTAYVLSGFFAALGGLLTLGWLGSPFISAGAGQGEEEMIRSIAAVVIGGTVFSGGEGGVLRTFIGVLILSLLFSLLTSLGIGGYGILIAQGLIIIIVMAIYTRIK